MALNIAAQEIIKDAINEDQVVKIILQVDGVTIEEKTATITGLTSGWKAKAIAKLFVEEYKA